MYPISFCSVWVGVCVFHQSIRHSFGCYIHRQDRCITSAFRHHASSFVAAASPSSSRSATRTTRNPTARRFGSSKKTTTTMAASNTPYQIPKKLRGLFGGSGVEGMSNPLMNKQILDLLPPDKKEVRVLYLGTATYDIAMFRDKQTARFRDNGCRVDSLDASTIDAVEDAAIAAIRSADILLVSGGNTLYAVDRWTHLGLVPHLREAMERGCILTGGSAGAICWFDSGHSDSADPETYRGAMMEQYGKKADGDTRDESSGFDPANQKEWKYLQVPGLGFVPGPFVCCPHHDKVQSNGLLRAHDFDQMLLARARSSQKSVLGIGIDHYAAFVVEGEKYRVYVLPEKPGSVSRSDAGPVFDIDDDGTPRGVPGVWLKRVLVGGGGGAKEEPVVEAVVCPSEGKLADLLEYGGDNLPDQNNIVNDDNQEAVETCRRENPSGIGA